MGCRNVCRLWRVSREEQVNRAGTGLRDVCSPHCPLAPSLLRVKQLLVVPGPWDEMWVHPSEAHAQFPHLSLPQETTVLTVGCLQDDRFTVRPDAGGVEGLDPGIVGAVEMEAVDGAQGLLADIHLLKDSQDCCLGTSVIWKIFLSNTLTLKVLELWNKENLDKWWQGQRPRPSRTLTHTVGCQPLCL